MIVDTDLEVAIVACHDIAQLMQAEVVWIGKCINDIAIAGPGACPLVQCFSRLPLGHAVQG